jgi:hypothetical protein
MNGLMPCMASRGHSIIFIGSIDFKDKKTCKVAKGMIIKFYSNKNA